MAGPVVQRGFWASRLGFILAAAGSAVGLGNIWSFPYITGSNGGGLFIVLYFVCVVLVGLPIMNAEILLGRASQASPVMALRRLAGKGSGWVSTGWLGMASGFVILSFYSVVAGWTLYYAYFSVVHGFGGQDPVAIKKIFTDLMADPRLGVGLHGAFMVATVSVVIGGVQSGIERWSRILMPALFTTLIGLAIYALTLDGAGQAMGFLFGMHTDKLAATGALEALGQAFFSLSLGMGAMLTYGSYLPKETSIFRSALWVAGLDTLVALLAGAVIFPVTFTYGISPSEGPGLVFQSLPVAFSKMPGGHILAIIFFSLLIFAALTSSISLLEVVASTAIDLWGWTRKKAVAVMGAIIFIVGIPSALSGGDLFGNGLKSLIGLSFFDLMYKSSANYMLPLGGMLIALYVGWAIDKKTCEQEMDSEKMGGIYGVWKVLLQFVAPLAVLLVMANSTGLIKAIIGEKK